MTELFLWIYRLEVPFRYPRWISFSSCTEGLFQLWTRLSFVLAWRGVMDHQKPGRLRLGELRID
jgi:hypothetical protein